MVRAGEASLFRVCGGRARIVGESLDRGGDRFGELLKTLNQLCAAGAAEAVKQPPGALERLGELLDGVSRRDHRGLRLDLDCRAPGKDVVEVDPANTDAAANADGGQFPAVYPVFQDTATPNRDLPGAHGRAVPCVFQHRLPPGA